MNQFSFSFLNYFCGLRDFLPFRVLQDKNHVKLVVRFQKNAEECDCLISGQVSQGEGHLVCWVDGPGGYNHGVVLQGGAVE